MSGRRLAFLLCAGLVLAPGCRLHGGARPPAQAAPAPMQQPVRGPPQPAPPQPSEANPTGKGNAPASAAMQGPAASTPGPTPLALGIFDVSLPACAEDGAGTEAERDFCTAATRAVRRAYEDDDDDPALLVSLAHALEVQPALVNLAPAWRSPLSYALARSESLRELGPTLRLLRRAMADAYLDQIGRIYRGVDTQACRAAFALLPDDAAAWLEMVVTVEPLGTYALSRLRSFCFERRTLSWRPVWLPAHAATARLVLARSAPAHLATADIPPAHGALAAAQRHRP